MTGQSRPPLWKREKFWVIALSISLPLLLLGGCSAWLVAGLLTLRIPEGQKSPAEILAAAKSVPTVDGLIPQGEFGDSCNNINDLICGHSAGRFHWFTEEAFLSPRLACTTLQQQLTLLAQTLTKPASPTADGRWNMSECLRTLSQPWGAYGVSTPGRIALFGESQVSMFASMEKGEVDVSIRRSG